MSTGSTYERTTVHLTGDQLRWLRRVSAQARLEDVPISASDVVRLALDSLRKLPDDELRKRLVMHVHAEAAQYPGRLKKGMPTDGATRADSRAQP